MDQRPSGRSGLDFFLRLAIISLLLLPVLPYRLQAAVVLGPPLPIELPPLFFVAI